VIVGAPVKRRQAKRPRPFGSVRRTPSARRPDTRRETALSDSCGVRRRSIYAQIRIQGGGRQADGQMYIGAVQGSPTHVQVHCRAGMGCDRSRCVSGFRRHPAVEWPNGIRCERRNERVAGDLARAALADDLFDPQWDQPLGSRRLVNFVRGKA